MSSNILVTARSFFEIPGPHQQLLQGEGQYKVVRTAADRPLKAAELIPLVEGVEALVAGTDEITAQVIDGASSLKVISRFGVGVDNVDLKAATRRGIVVANTPGANAVSVAELTMALILALARHIPHHDRLVKEGQWQRLPGQELSGAVLGLVGMGRVGQEVSRRAAAFGLRVVYCDPVPPPQEFLDQVGASSLLLDAVLSESDVVSLHLPLSEDTRNIIDARALEQMKPSALLVNTARGGLIDEEALYEALIQGRLAGAACDCFWQEPPAGSRLLTLDNFIATPHMGSTTVQATVRMGVMAAENALAVLRGERPEHVVNPEVYERRHR